MKLHWTGWIGILAVVAWVAVPGGGRAGAAEEQGDFDGSGRLGLADFFLLVDALGGDDPAYDLDGDGRVGIEDVMAFVGLFASRDSVKATGGKSDSTGVGDGTDAVDADSAAVDSTGGDSGGTADSVAVDTVVADSVGVDTTVADTVLADTTTVDTTVADTVLADTTTVDTTVADTVLVDTILVDTTVADTVWADTTTVDSIVVDTVAVDSVGLDTAVDTVVVDTTVADTVFVDSVMADTTTVDSIVVDTVAVDSVGVDTMVADTVAVDTVFVDSTRVDTVSTDSVGLDSTALDSVAADTVVVDSTIADTVFVDSTGVDTVQVDTVFVDSTRVDSMYVDSTGVDTVFVDSTRVDSVVVDSVRYSIEALEDRTRAFFPGYSITVQHGGPFGIVDLRLRGQPVNFAHWQLPLGDWEWFWFADEQAADGRTSVKLLQPAWEPPAVERRADGAVLRFRRADATRAGIDLEVVYRLQGSSGSDGEAGFAVDYWIHNRTGDRLAEPYAMLGLPGFANQSWVVEVADALRRRTPAAPYTNFQAEARAQERTEYLLLRHDVDPGEEGQELRGEVVLGIGSLRYRLTARFAVDDAKLRRAYSAHTNKPAYLTSHLYLFMRDMGPGESRRLTVQYVLSVNGS